MPTISLETSWYRFPALLATDPVYAVRLRDWCAANVDARCLGAVYRAPVHAAIREIDALTRRPGDSQASRCGRVLDVLDGHGPPEALSVASRARELVALARDAGRGDVGLPGDVRSVARILAAGV